MGKAKKMARLGRKFSKPGPLENQILQDCYTQLKGSRKIRGNRRDDDEPFVEGELGRKIIKQSIAQLQELKDEIEAEEHSLTLLEESDSKQILLSGTNDDIEVDDEELVLLKPIHVDSIVHSFEQELKIEEKDFEIVKHFTNNESVPQKTIANLFRDKITEKQTDIQSQIDMSSVQHINVAPEVCELCHDIGNLLSKYRSGALPKMFKVLPNMRNWEELVFLTNPDKWSAAAMYQATRIFASNLRENMAQRFFNLVLLPRIRDDISFYKRLNFHLYQALCKALYKPSAFFKGILLPLCLSGNTSLREAIIVGSVVAKNHIPILHSAAALLKIVEMDYSGPTSVFIRILLDKKYALPYRVIDACVYHFVKFRSDKRELPVLWHQAFLTFVVCYKEDISSEQKEALLEVLQVHTHHKITSEIRRELINSQSRDISKSCK